MAKNICRTCRLFVEGDYCPICKKSNFTTQFKGRIIILNPEKSKIAKKLGIKYAGEYAIKIR